MYLTSSIAPLQVVPQFKIRTNSLNKNNEKLFDAVKSQNPDFILVGGDMLVGKPEVSTKVAEDFVGQLTGICPVYYANGNHEQRMKIYPEKFGTKYQEYKTSVEQSGVQFLENEHIDLMFEKNFDMTWQAIECQ